jgi:hypothetical protein
VSCIDGNTAERELHQTFYKTWSSGSLRFSIGDFAEPTLRLVQELRYPLLQEKCQIGFGTSVIRVPKGVPFSNNL